VLVKVGIVVGVLTGWLWSGTSLALVITILQITNSGGCSHHPAINKDGSRVGFLSDANLTGNKADGNEEIFLWNSKAGFAQLTNTIDFGKISGLVINAAGNRVAFTSDLDLVGSNADRNQEIFLWDSATGISQMTNTVDEGEEHITNFDPAIDKKGDVIAFTVQRTDASLQISSQEIAVADIARK